MLARGTKDLHTAFSGPNKLTGKELLAKHISTPVHRHRPEYEQGDGHEGRQAPRNDRRLLQLLLLCSLLLRALARHRGHDIRLDTHAGTADNVAIIAPANGLHALPVVILAAKAVSQDRHKEQRAQQRCHVACQHRIVRACTIHIEHAAFLLGRHKPCDQCASKTQYRRAGGSLPILVLPHQRERGGDDRAGDDAAHHQIQVSHGYTRVEETGGETCQEDRVDNARDVGHANQEFAIGFRVDVRLVDVVCPDGRDGDEFGGRGGRDGHENQEERGAGSAFAEQGYRSVWEDKAGRDVCVGHAVRISWENGIIFEREGRETHRRGA